MSVSGRVQVLNEVSVGPEDGWRLCFQWCRYVYDSGELEDGYRFIWRRPDGSLQAARGQARLPSVRVITELLQMAKSQKWDQHVGTHDDAY